MALSKSHLPCLVLVKPRKRGGRTTDLDCDEAGDYVVPNVLSPRDLVFRHDNMDQTVPHTCIGLFIRTDGRTDRQKDRKPETMYFERGVLITRMRRKRATEFVTSDEMT